MAAAALDGVIVGGAIGVVGTLAASVFTNVFARQRERAAFVRAQRAAKRDRLHGHYASLLRTAQAFADVAGEMVWLPAGDTEEARDERLREYSAKAWEAMGDAFFLVKLEEESAEVAADWEACSRAFAVHQVKWQGYKVEGSGITVLEVRDSLEAVKAALAKFAEDARRHLGELSNA